MCKSPSFIWLKISRLLITCCVALGLVLESAGAQPIKLLTPDSLRKPNIIFILADDLGYGELGCYGQKKIKTPNIDKLAAEGMRFTQCYAGSPVCAPSRCVLMTGLHTGHAIIRGNASIPLRPEDQTVAEFLKKADYRTCAVGKWGLGLERTTGAPNKKGFDEWLGYLDQLHAHNYYPTQIWRNTNLLLLDRNLGGRKGDYTHDLFTRVSTNFLRMSKGRPFFLYVAFTIPHANNELKEKGMEVPSDEPYSKEPWPQAEKNKAAMITRLDDSVGKIMTRLKELGLEENTVVFFSSDNGPHKEGGVDPKFFESSGPLRGIKRDVYEGGIRVPMIVRWPGRVKPGAISDRVWAFWDFLPTAAAIAGLKPPSDIDGISMLPAMLGKPQKDHDFLYWEFHEDGFSQAVRMGDWKAVRFGPDKPLELYQLKADPGEKENIAASNRGIVKKIEEYLASARTESKDWPVKKEDKTK